ncbi:MAG: hypothetical protein ACRBCI_09345 [Cellvibrionaceae bacterium]
MSANPRKYLNEARSAFKSKDYGKALSSYEYFFDHALDEDGSSLYGVRLSYCLDEWAKLGEAYPLAKERLIQRRDGCLNLLTQTYEPELFHDYIAICQYLKCSHMPIEVFKNIHNENKKLANDVIRYIWDELVSNKLWDLCDHYLPDPQSEYTKCLSKHDSLVKMLQENPDMGGYGYEQQMNGWVVRDLSNILLVLKNNNRMGIFTSLISKAKSDLNKRDQDELFVQVQERVAL